MGIGQSKPKIANSPFEAAKLRKEAIRKKEKQIQKKKLLEEKLLKKENKKKSKAEKNLKNIPPPIATDVPERQSTFRLTEEAREELVIKTLKLQLARDSSKFVLNNALLSFQFFTNYTREMQESLIRMEQDENNNKHRLIKHNKHVILPNLIHDAVNHSIKFRRRHGADNTELIPLVPQTMYIVYENIVILEPTEEADSVYSTVGKIRYKMKIDNDGKFNMVKKTMHDGYVKVLCIEGFDKNRELHLHKPKPRDSLPLPNVNIKDDSYSNDDIDDDEDDDEDEDPYVSIKTDDDEDEKTYDSKLKFRDSIAVSKLNKMRLNQTDDDQDEKTYDFKPKFRDSIAVSKLNKMRLNQNVDDEEEETYNSKPKFRDSIAVSKLNKMRLNQNDDNEDERTYDSKLKFRDSIAVSKLNKMRLNQNDDNEDERTYDSISKFKDNIAVSDGDGEDEGNYDSIPRFNKLNKSELNQIDDDDDKNIYDSTTQCRDSIAVSKLNKMRSTKMNGMSTKKVIIDSASSSDYDYTYITALNTPQSINNIKIKDSPNFESTKIIPNSCVVDVLLPKPEVIDPDDCDNSIEYIPTYKQCLSSTKFFSYFVTTFSETLGEELRFPWNDIVDANYKGGTIYVGPWEVVPAIHCPWPEAEAFEWVQRHRKSSKNIVSKTSHQWPTLSMINHVKSLGCYIIPDGYSPKLESNPDRELEWKVVFPEAEQYLENCLTHQQVKIYLITIALFKTFIEPRLDNSTYIFSTEHLRHYLFWQCEYNYTAWPEDFLGDVLLRFLNGLLHCLSINQLRDYFLPRRNLLENIPAKLLNKIQNGFHRITENLLIHVMIVLKNLEPIEKQNFYPLLDYHRLYKAISNDDNLPELLKGDKSYADELLERQRQKEIEERNKNYIHESSEEEKVGPLEYINKKKKKNKKKGKMTVTFNIGDEKEKPKISTDSFSLGIHVEEHATIYRRRVLYIIFIKHFLKMAAKSYKFESLNQALIYLKQAELICKLEDTYSDLYESNSDVINTYKMEVIKAMNDENYTKPKLPRRESINPKTIKRRRSTLKLKNEDHEEYTNLPAVRPTRPSVVNKAIEPADFSSDEDEAAEDIKKQAETKKVIEIAQIHRPAEFENENENDLGNILGNVTTPILPTEFKFDSNDFPELESKKSDFFNEMNAKIKNMKNSKKKDNQKSRVVTDSEEKIVKINISKNVTVTSNQTEVITNNEQKPKNLDFNRRKSILKRPLNGVKLTNNGTSNISNHVKNVQNNKNNLLNENSKNEIKKPDNIILINGNAEDSDEDTFL